MRKTVSISRYFEDYIPAGTVHLVTPNLPSTNRTQLLVCLAAAWVQSWQTMHINTVFADLRDRYSARERRS
jgi:hypothetical protein